MRIPLVIVKKNENVEQKFLESVAFKDLKSSIQRSGWFDVMSYSKIKLELRDSRAQSCSVRRTPPKNFVRTIAVKRLNASFLQ